MKKLQTSCLGLTLSSPKGMRFFVLFLLLLCCRCARDPELNFDPSGGEIVSIAQLKTRYAGYPLRVAGEVYIEGTIVGLLPRGIAIEDATGGIEIRAQLADAVGRYERGERLSVRCNSLTISDYGGAIQLGWGEAGNPIPAERMGGHLRVTGAASEVLPHPFTFPEGLAGRWVNCWVRVEGVQIASRELGLTWGETETGVDRHLVDAQADTLAVRIDADSPLADMLIPAGSGFVEGILGYFNGNYQLIPLSGAHVRLDGTRF